MYCIRESVGPFPRSQRCSWHTGTRSTCLNAFARRPDVHLSSSFYFSTASSSLSLSFFVQPSDPRSSCSSVLAFLFRETTIFRISDCLWDCIRRGREKCFVVLICWALNLERIPVEVGVNKICLDSVGPRWHSKNFSLYSITYNV